MLIEAPLIERGFFRGWDRSPSCIAVAVNLQRSYSNPGTLNLPVTASEMRDLRYSLSSST